MTSETSGAGSLRYKGFVRAPERIETERLVLRRPTEDDAEAIFAGWASDPEVTRYEGWPTHRSVDDTREFLRRADGLWRRFGIGPVVILENGIAVGSSGLDPETPTRAEIGYVLARSAWGRGIAT